MALCASIYLGSRGLRDFDSALVPYAVASIFLAFGIAHRYTVWVSAPGANRVFKKGWLSDRIGPAKVLAACLAVLAVAAVFQSLTPDLYPWATIAFLVMAAVYGATDSYRIGLLALAAVAAGALPYTWTQRSGRPPT